MGLFTFIKERLSYLVVGLITIAILAFIISDVVRNGTPFFREAQNQVGTVGGEKITYEDFSDKLKQKEDQFKSQYRTATLPEQSKHFINDQAWNELVSKIILDKEISKTGLAVGINSDEATNMVIGNTPDPQIQQAFTDPQTGIFDRSKVSNFLRSMDKDPSGDSRKKWDQFQRELVNNRGIQKYLQLIQGGMYITSLERSLSLAVPSRRNIDYVLMDYSRIPDNQVKLTDQDLQHYYDQHAYLYQLADDQRSFDFVAFHAVASAEDSILAKKDIAKLALDFKQTTDDSLFVSINGESKAPLNFYKKGQLPPVLDSNLKNLPVGSIYGPYFQLGAYKVAKLVAVRDLPDSVKARHILLTDGAAGQTPVNYPGLLKKADSLKSVILAGGNFAALASQYSADKGSAIKGGELGFAAMGTFVKPFQDAVFYGKPGEYKIVQTQFGVHLIQIEEQKNVSKAYLVGIVDRPFGPSNKTVQENYAKATQFLSAAQGKDFAAEARKRGLAVRPADDIAAGDAQVGSLENSRKVVQWAYAAKLGAVSEVIDLGETAVVARLREIKAKGLMPLESVKGQVQAAVFKRQKGDMLSDKFTEAIKSGLSFKALAGKLSLTVVKADSLVFSNPSIGANIQEPQVVGAAFGAAVNRVSKPIAAERGVYLLEVTGETALKPLPDLKISQNQLLSTRKASADKNALDALKKLANVTDNRAKFF